jgi:glutathione peroxidase
MYNMKHFLMRIKWVSAVLLLFGCGVNNNTAEGDTSAYKAAQAKGDIYQFTMKSLTGQDVPLSTYKGKVVLIVNTASKCGLTPQYKGIEALYEKYKDKGLVVLGFPANDFLRQEPGSNSEIGEFCQKNYGVSFPMFSKIEVTGKDKNPLYKYLTEKKENGVVDAAVTWNFQKFLIDKNGHVVTYFKPNTEVTEPTVVKAIEDLL